MNTSTTASITSTSESTNPKFTAHISLRCDETLKTGQSYRARLISFQLLGPLDFARKLVRPGLLRREGACRERPGVGETDRPDHSSGNDQYRNHSVLAGPVLTTVAPLSTAFSVSIISR